MPTRRSARLRLAIAAVAATFVLGCASPAPSAPPPDAAPVVTSAAATANRDAVLVAADYGPPKGRVDSTGAYIPVNGKPTLVFVDAIW